MKSDLIGFETVADIVKGWPGEGDNFPRPAKHDNDGRPLWEREDIVKFAYQMHGVSTHKMLDRYQ
ncbi:hypothetical protein [Thalassospira lohafexi]|uniref:Uncharacterized protein n=1 Tax=Thalassospira lohafexi TaxID=744227 RepID=A0A2N3LB68_9PROT|nr:hypothetical protein [Thalassospira lohafexi]PKR60075.1 hypothetical protein COO92_01495 [Thalassospira lohafexi]